MKDYKPHGLNSKLLTTRKNNLFLSNYECNEPPRTTILSYNDNTFDHPSILLKFKTGKITFAVKCVIAGLNTNASRKWSFHKRSTSLRGN